MPVASAHITQQVPAMELKRFHVSSAAGAIQVRWEMEDELGCSFFQVERSADDMHYEVLGRVAGDAMAVTARTHSFLDEEPLPGHAYYRLRQVDLDGFTRVSLKQLVNTESAQQLVATR
jgi:hypothetical protein